MVDISKDQYKMLKRIRKNKLLSTTSFTDKEIEICDYLLSEKLVDGMYDVVNMKTGSSEITKVSITQKGEVQIYSFMSTFYKWWIPVVISITAFIFSMFK